jgi:hypothetical protein
MIPEGKYKAKARSAQLGEASTGAEQIGIEFEIIDGEQKGSRYSYYGTFGEAAVEITLKAMRAAGWQGDDVTDLASLNRPDTPDCQIVIAHEEYPKGSGKMHTKIKWVNPFGGLAMKNPLDQTKKQALSARIRATVAQVDQELKSSGQGNGGAKPAGDVPF